MQALKRPAFSALATSLVCVLLVASPMDAFAQLLPALFGGPARILNGPGSTNAPESVVRIVSGVAGSGSMQRVVVVSCFSEEKHEFSATLVGQPAKVGEIFSIVRDPQGKTIEHQEWALLRLSEKERTALGTCRW